MTDAGYDASLRSRRKVGKLGLGPLGRPDRVGAAVKDDGRHRDRRTLGEPPLDRVQAPIAQRVAVAVAIRVDHHRYEIGIVERRGRALERCGLELPGRRPFLPQQPADVAPVLLEAATGPAGIEVPLRPERTL